MSHDSSEASVLAFSFEVRSLVTELNGALTTLFRPLGLTCVQAEALMALGQLGPVTLKRLGDHLVAESGHPSRLVSKLVADGLVARRASESDGRAVVLELTSRGRDLAARAREARAPLLIEFSARFGGRLDQAIGVLRDVRSALTGAAPGPADDSAR
ncbi:MarR family winged helix-turn-helix transcriptional regulator [Raineyella sp. W15-4]|uniref:MarR family winged helix-turn-helix transcriptional regulator n=1 Tax=Raineyella sp. W15-4 TaxID=3081651 RepID=UPI0029546784|nr:winged helix DNA-binding protein [Raineyella sp. W15-4]WOQ15788.1 winged helix DNA-binding protein [Raineyella sp. W15-4]